MLRAAAVVSLLAALAPAQALAYGYRVRVTPLTPNLGTVVSAPGGESVFRIDPASGLVTRISGSAIRMTPGTTRAMVSISCDDDGDDGWDDSDDWYGGGYDNDDRDDGDHYEGDGHGHGDYHDSGCGGRVNVKIGSAGSPSGRAGPLTNFTVDMGSAQLHSGPTGTSPISFSLKPIHKRDTVTFYVGADFPIRGDDSSAGTGYALSSFYVYVSKHPLVPTRGAVGTAIARTNKPIALSVPTQLNFGIIARPRTGTSMVAVDAHTQTRTVTGTALGFAMPAPTAAEYKVTGEDMQTLHISIPSTITMTGPGQLTVTTNNDLPGSPMLNANGEFRFRVGGSFPLTSTTPLGSYVGSFPVTVSYN